MKIGLPRSLLYYYYFPFWKKLFEELEIQLVLSDRNSTDLLNRGIKESISEICVPMKIYIGQVLNLIDKGIDLIYIPRFVSIKKGITFCPKFLGLPDMIKNSLHGIKDKVLTHHIESEDDDISGYHNYQIFEKKLGINQLDLKRALNTASKNWHHFRKLQQQGYDTQKLLEGKQVKQINGDITIGLLGYVYNIYDSFINMNLIDQLNEMGVRVITFEMLDNSVIDNELNKFKKPMFWQFTNKIMGAGYHFIHSADVAGIIHLTAFGCGPDSILGPFLEIDADRKNKPFMTLRIDEQTGESHLLTRIEAFIDLLKLNKGREII